MKTQLSLLAIGAFFLHSTGITPAQLTEKKLAAEVKVSGTTATPDFSFFRAHRQTRNGATVTWGFSSCTGVTGFEVQRNVFYPIEEWAWETVSMNPCSGARSYKFTDAPVETGYNTYRVVAKMSDGSEVVSDMATIHIISH